jgi:hypothetical protein
MARARRITLPFFPHYVRQPAVVPAFADEEDHRAYLYVLGRAASRHHLAVLGYALEPAAVHLLVLPVTAPALSRTIGQVNREYALWRHIRERRNEAIWAGRFQSCAFDRPQIWAAMRYVEGLPAAVSSREAHHRGEDPESVLDLELWREVYGPARWARFAGIADPVFEAALRNGAATGQPLVEMAQTRAATR